MKNKVVVITGLSLIVIGLIISLKSLNITGNVIAGVDNMVSSILGIVLIVGGMLLFLIRENS